MSQQSLPISGRKACVMGYRVAYSRSPLLHNYWLRTLALDGVYELMDISPEEFPAFLHHIAERGFVGGNVTKPHKEAAFELVDDRDHSAVSIGAVNTIWLEEGRLIGSNTDGIGFLANLDERVPGWDRSEGLAVVLGAGGAARAVVYALTRRGLDVVVVNRTPERASELVRRFQLSRKASDYGELSVLLPDVSVLVNATSAGHPLVGFDLRRMRAGAVVADLTYVPIETELLRDARRAGLRAVDGLGMLLHQAVPGFARWFGVTPNVTSELRALLEADIRNRVI
jgi:shikimate dehydrogenase